MDQKGITLIEILVVIGLIAIVAGFTLATTFDAFRGYGYRNERDILISSLHKARSQAVSNICIGSPCTEGKPHGVHIDSDPVSHLVLHYVIFQGTTYAGRDVTADETLNSNYAVSTTGLTDIVFTELSGDPTGASVGTVTISDPNGVHQGALASAISMNAEGQIVWTN